MTLRRYRCSVDPVPAIAKTHHHIPSTDEQRARTIAAAREAMKRIMLPLRAEQREWERLRARAEAALDDAPTMVRGRRELPEITAVHRLRRERAWLDSAVRPVSAFERVQLARAGGER